MQEHLFDNRRQNGRETCEEGPDSFARALNPAQFEAVTATDGPVLVIAGAGSGKTRTLVYRVAWLLAQGVAPESILLLTFTRKAAQEMLRRAGELLGRTCSGVCGGTFHAVANTLLRRYASCVGYPSFFTIIDRGDAEGIIKLLIASLNLSGAGKRFPSKRVVLNVLSGVVNRARPLDDLLSSRYSHLLQFAPDIARLDELYQQFKRDHALMDYDDLLVNFKNLLQDHPEVRRELSHRFQYILVDEYQDTNPIQARIVALISETHGNVMAVGDDAQSIYSFRGADYKNIIDFPTFFPGTKVVTLEENYRSVQPVLTLTNEIISQARQRYTKKLFSNKEGGEIPRIVALSDEQDEACFVVEHILELQKKGMPLEQMAVLFRSGFHSFKLELALNARQIPFVKRGGLKLTESAHVKDMLSYFRVLENPSDFLSWNRILLLLEKVGPRTVQKMLDSVRSRPDSLAGLAVFPAKAAWKEGFDALVTTLRQLQEKRPPPVDLFDRLLEYYTPVLERIYYDDYPKRLADLEQLKNILAGYDDLKTFLDDAALDPPDIDTGRTRENSGEGCLVLSTIHSAKGLEWEAVFVISLAEGRFPSTKHTDDDDEWEEERRLLYVAATRAKQHLFLTYPRRLVVHGQGFETVFLTPFLEHLPQSCAHFSCPHRQTQSATSGFWAGHAGEDQRQPRFGAGNAPKERGNAKNQVSYLTSTRALAKDMCVIHPFFGRGVVEQIVTPKSVVIHFDRHGRKTIHLDYARLLAAS